MSDQRNGGIVWTEQTWNPLRGCSRVSQGCVNCYAESMAARFCGAGQPYEGTINPDTKRWNGTIKLVPEHLQDPLRWKRPRMVFVNSMSDLFHPDVPFEFIDKVFAVMALAKQHTFQVLTKRPERMLEYFKSFHSAEAEARGWNVCAWAAEQFGIDIPGTIAIGQTPKGLPNVWIGVTVENQEAADKRIPLLLQVPAAVHWVSMEPLLGKVDIRRWIVLGRWDSTGRRLPTKGIDWVVVGGESGPHSRPVHPDWVRGLRDQCAEAGVPFLFKQWGEWLPDNQNANMTPPHDQNGAIRVGKKSAGRLLDCVQHDGYPEVKP